MSDLSHYTVKQLRGMLKVRGCKVSGTKAELIERLNTDCEGEGFSTVQNLKILLRQAGCSTSGTKDELLKRLENKHLCSAEEKKYKVYLRKHGCSTSGTKDQLKNRAHKYRLGDADSKCLMKLKAKKLRARGCVVPRKHQNDMKWLNATLENLDDCKKRRGFRPVFKNTSCKTKAELTRFLKEVASDEYIDDQRYLDDYIIRLNMGVPFKGRKLKPNEVLIVTFGDTSKQPIGFVSVEDAIKWGKKNGAFDEHEYWGGRKKSTATAKNLAEYFEYTLNAIDYDRPQYVVSSTVLTCNELNRLKLLMAENSWWLKMLG